MGVMGILSPSELQHSAAPFADAARMVWGTKASGLIAAGAAIACFGALNGWILIQGQIPMAASRDKLFPPVFKKESARGVPLSGLLISSVLAMVLVGFNYTRGLVDMFSFIIKLATLSCLLPYLFSSLTELSLHLRKKKTLSRKELARVIVVSIPAFLYSLWAITGLDAEVLFWGIGLLALGLPVFLLQRKSSKKL
jgi:APA family basic amino acid/polyamine antiporter